MWWPWSGTSCYWERVTPNGQTIANDFVSFAPEGVKNTIKASDGGIEVDGCGAFIPA